MQMLDETKPYGTVCGPTANGVRFEQDGKQFNSRRELITDEPTKPVEVKPEDKTVDIDDDTIKILQLLDTGKTYGQVGKIMGMHHNKVKGIAKRANG